jgi:hypothetical protein
LRLLAPTALLPAVPENFVVDRVLEVAPGLVLELRVPTTTASLWHPMFLPGERLFRDAAVSRAQFEAVELLRCNGIEGGRWRVTWLGRNTVIEPA